MSVMNCARSKATYVFRLSFIQFQVYCMEYLESNMSWLKTELGKVKGKYLLFDCPGQVELYTHNNAVKSIVAELIKMDVRLVSVHLVDSHYCR